MSARGGGRGARGGGRDGGGGRGRDGGRGGGRDGGRGGGRGFSSGRGGGRDGGRDGGRGGGRGGGLSESMSNLSLVAPPPPVKSTLLPRQTNSLYPSRPSFGTLGKKTVIWANHFQVSIKQNQGDVYHYDVMFAPEGKKPSQDLPAKDLCATVLRYLVVQLKQHYPNIACVTDARRNMYTNTALDFEEKMFKVTFDDDGRSRVFDVYVKIADPAQVRLNQIDQLFTGRLNYTPYDAIQALDIAMRYSASLRFTSVGRNFFTNNNAQSLGEGAEMWYGYHQSLRPTQSQLTLNVDMSATAFVEKMAALEFMVQTCNFNSTPQYLSKQQHSLASKMFRGVKIRVTHRGTQKRQSRVNGLSPKSARDTFFEDENGKKMSVVQYFKSQYGITLQYPDLPCLHVGNPQGKIYYPIEVCATMEGQRFMRKVNENQVANMIRFTCTPPEERRRRIEAQVQSAHFETDNSLEAFGLSVSPTMMSVEARQLPEPDMLYAKNQIERPNGGQWNMRNKGFAAPSVMKSFAIISLCDPRRVVERDIQEFFEALVKQMGDLGMGKPS
ncbi:Argonaute2 (AGO2), partial [Thraustotheca clavata]